jgi:hypothetical protein
MPTLTLCSEKQHVEAGGVMLDSFVGKMNEFACKLVCWLVQQSKKASESSSAVIDTFTKGKFGEMKLQILDKKAILLICRGIPSPNRLYSIFQFVEGVLKAVCEQAPKNSFVLRGEDFTQTIYSNVMINGKYGTWWLKFLRVEEELATQLEGEIQAIEQACKDKLRNEMEIRLKEYMSAERTSSDCRMCKFEALNNSSFSKEELKMPAYEDGLFGSQMVTKVKSSKSIFRFFQKKK